MSRQALVSAIQLVLEILKIRKLACDTASNFSTRLSYNPLTALISRLLFIRFQRGRNALCYQGSGSGLAIANAILDELYGRMVVDNSSQATGFTISFPKSEDKYEN